MRTHVLFLGGPLGLQRRGTDVRDGAGDAGRADGGLLDVLRDLAGRHALLLDGGRYRRSDLADLADDAASSSVAAAVRSRLTISQPLFVHSNSTTMVQMADIFAYVISWGCGCVPW
ncbi:DUF3800 domain-containing protein [Skermanella aerolata]|uniref:DUF3800 domain-containing protein n=1 Tax=Skermanella aerolata TaxID=393310 RepID=UPI0014702E18